MNQPTILLLGARGQVGQALQAISPQGYELLMPTRAQLDITNTAAISDYVLSAKPALVINCAAYNQVDQAEQERDICYAVNAVAVEQLARACDQLSIPLIHFSTDYVFPGRAATEPLYVETDTPAPLSHYGQSKYDGECAAARFERNLVLRVSWVFSEYGANMGSRMLAAARAGQPLRMATDQWGSPTYAGHIAQLVWALVPGLLAGEPGGLYHLTGLDAKSAPVSRFELAQALIAAAGDMLPPDYSVQASTQAEWEASFGKPAANRPQCAAMANNRLAERLGRALPSWREGALRCAAGIRAQS